MLYEHQKKFLEKNPDKSALVWSCGTGKTRAALEWANKDPYPSSFEKPGFALVICPKALKANWRREMQKYIPWECGMVMTKEEFRRDHQKIGYHGSIIVDEVHNGFLTPNFKSQMSKALRNYIKKHNVPRVLLLSATVYTSSPWNIFNLAVLTGHDWNWKSFDYTFFDRIWMGRRQVPVPKKGIEKRLAEAVKKIADVVDIKDVIDVPLQNHLEPEYFSLSNEQKAAIKEAYDPLPIVRFTAQHTIEQGIVIGNEFKESQSFHCDKNDRIIDLCKENKKVAIVCRYNFQIAVLLDLLEKEGLRVAVISGKAKAQDRDYTTRIAEETESIVVIIQADCGIGFELPSFEVCIYASMSYSYTSWEQMNGRFLRMNKPSRTTFIYLLTEGGSIDQAVYDAIQRKEDFAIELFKRWKKKTLTPRLTNGWSMCIRRPERLSWSYAKAAFHSLQLFPIKSRLSITPSMESWSTKFRTVATRTLLTRFL